MVVAVHPPRLLSNAFEMVSSEHRWYAANAVTLQFPLVSTTAYFHLHSTSLHVYDNIERLKYVMTSHTYTVTIKRVERLRYLKNLDGRGYLYDGYSTPCENRRTRTTYYWKNIINQMQQSKVRLQLNVANV